MSRAFTPAKVSCRSRPAASRVVVSAEPVSKLPRREALLSLLTVAPASIAYAAQGASSEFASSASMDKLNRQGPYQLSDAEWKAKLSTGQYNVLRKESTERPFASPLNNEKRQGTFKCAGCDAPLFPSSAKFDSGTGWPSFADALPGAVEEVPDYSIIFLPRTEVRCKNCQGHVGHVFNDGPKPTGLRYCMNGLALAFEPASA